MKILSTVLATLLIGCLTAFNLEIADPDQEIKSLLTEFLQKVDKKEMHDRFWAEELVYTSSSGERFGKDKIMEGFDGEEESDVPSVTYTAEQVEIKTFGKVAVLAFQLVANADGGTSRYWNSGTLVKRNGEWKVVTWQATKAKE